MYQNRVVSVAIALLLLLAAGCGTSNLPRTERPADEQLPVEYRAVYLIHGDGDYLYHDAEGNALQADRQVLREATAVAEQASRGEVFIFHQKPERRILWLFPQKDRVMLHYRNGNLVNTRRYSPAGPAFGREAELMAALGNSNADRNALLYFGHEIPQGERPGYHRSRPDVPFGEERFAEGSAMLHDSWDLIALSTCNNGTPRIASALSGLADWLLASPQNLHLSHIDTEKLLLWEEDPSLDGDSIATAIADDTFRRLEREVQTVISLAVYPLDDPDMLRAFARAADRGEESAADEPGAESEPGTAPRAAGDMVDCADLPFYRDRYGGDIRIRYRAPMFGRGADKQEHSGWGCQPD